MLLLVWPYKWKSVKTIVGTNYCCGTRNNPTCKRLKTKEKTVCFTNDNENVKSCHKSPSAFFSFFSQLSVNWLTTFTLKPFYSTQCGVRPVIPVTPVYTCLPVTCRESLDNRSVDSLKANCSSVLWW